MEKRPLRSQLPIFIALLAGIGGGLVSAPARAALPDGVEAFPLAVPLRRAPSPTTKSQPVELSPQRPRREELRRVRQRMYCEAKRAGFGRQFAGIMKHRNGCDLWELRQMVRIRGIDDLAPWLVYLESAVPECES